MVIAALETATRAGSVALAVDDICVARFGDPARPHGDRLPAELTEWIGSHGRRLDDIDLFAVVSGPGSFTGLRVGMATVQGLAFAGSRKVVGVPTLDAIAEAWFMTGHTGDPAPVLAACLDGQRGEVFAAAWDVSSARSVDEASSLLAPLAVKPEALATVLGALAGERAVALVGDGAVRYADVLGRVLPRATFEPMPLPLAQSAARLASRRAALGGAPHALRPIYLRQPDAATPRDRAARAWAYSVRRLQSRADLSAVEALQRQTFANPWGAEAIRWELENTDVARLYVLQDKGGAVVGYCACWVVFDELHINSLAIDATRRRQGLARRLLLHVLQEAAGEGVAAATLEVRRSNEAARQLYEGLGFAIEGVRRDYYQDPREDAIILWKRDLLARDAGSGLQG